MVAQVWPVGIDNLGSKIYFFFMAVNLVCVPIIWLAYPETKGRRLEDMDELFGGRKLGTVRLGEEADEAEGVLPAKAAPQAVVESRGSHS